MTTTLSHGWVIEIEGLGRVSGEFATSGDMVRPMALSMVGNSVRPADSRCDEYVPVLVPGSIRMGSQSIAPLSADPILQTLDFSIIIPDEYPEIAQFMLGDAQPAYRMVPGSTTVRPNSTSVYIESLDGTSPADYLSRGSIIYNRREAWRVWDVSSGAMSRATVTFLDRVSDPSGYYSPQSDDVQRSTLSNAAATNRAGHIGTAMTDHAPRPDLSGPPPWEDDRIYTSSPFVRGRSVTLYRVAYTNDGFRELLWGRFVISDSPRISDDGTVCYVSCRSWLSEAKDMELNANPSVFRMTYPDRNGIAQVMFPDGFEAFSPDPTPRIFGVGDSYETMAVAHTQQGTCLLQWREPEPYRPGFSPTGWRTAKVVPGYQFGGKAIEPRDVIETTDDKTLSATDVLVSDPISNVFDTDIGFFVGYIHPYGNRFTGEILTHPLDMLLAHLGAIPSNLPPQWVLRLDLQSVDIDGIKRLAEGKYSTTRNFPGVVAGVDGRPVRAFAWLADTFLRPLGLSWAVTGPEPLHGKPGQITVRGMDDGLTMERALPLSILLRGRSTALRTENVADSMQATVAPGVSNTPRLVVTAAQAYKNEFRRGSSRQEVIKADGVLSADDNADGDSVLGYSSVSTLRAYLATFGDWLSRGMREFVLNVQIGGANDPLEHYSAPGDIVLVSAPGMRGAPSAAQQHGVSGPVYAYLVLEQMISDDFTTQTLRLAQLGYDTARMAPAASVESVSSGDDGIAVVCYPDETILPDTEDNPYVTALYTAVDDGETFRTVAGDISILSVEFLDPFLEPASKSVPILSYDYPTNTFDIPQPEEYASSDPYLPQPEDWVVVTYDMALEYPSLRNATFTL